MVNIFLYLLFRAPQTKPQSTISASRPTTSHPSWRSTSETWAVPGADAGVPAGAGGAAEGEATGRRVGEEVEKEEEEEEEREEDAPKRLVPAAAHSLYERSFP